MVKVRLLKTVKIILLWLICLLTGYFFYHLNKLIGFIGDDFLYHFQYNGEWPVTQLKSVHNIWDLLVSVVVHTQTWNGRFVGDFFIQALMQFPKIVFNFANSLVFIVVGLLINLFAVRKFTEISSLSLLLTYLPSGFWCSWTFSWGSRIITTITRQNLVWRYNFWNNLCGNAAGIFTGVFAQIDTDSNYWIESGLLGSDSSRILKIDE